jgi:hypothetical protein
MAGEKLGYTYSASAKTDHTGKEGLAVIIGGGVDGLPQVELAGAGVKIDGVILRGDIQGATERIGKNGIIMMKVGAAIVGAGEVQIDANSCVITKAAGIAIGKVFAAAAQNDIVPVFVY